MDQTRRHRRAVGPPGTAPTEPEPRVERDEPPPSPQDDERLRRERPPHHEPRD